MANALVIVDRGVVFPGVAPGCPNGDCPSITSISVTGTVSVQIALALPDMCENSFSETLVPRLDAYGRCYWSNQVGGLSGNACFDSSVSCFSPRLALGNFFGFSAVVRLPITDFPPDPTVCEDNPGPCFWVVAASTFIWENLFDGEGCPVNGSAVANNTLMGLFRCPDHDGGAGSSGAAMAVNADFIT